MNKSSTIHESLVLDPERRNPFSEDRNIFCRKCLKPINDEINKVFKISCGIVVDDIFFPEKRSFYYHEECLHNLK